MGKIEINPLGKILFNSQRFQIIQAKRNTQTAHTVPYHYAYAWYDKVYPYFDLAEMHEDLKDYFDITEDDVHLIINYAQCYKNRNRIFYALL